MTFETCVPPKQRAGHRRSVTPLKIVVESRFGSISLWHGDFTCRSTMEHGNRCHFNAIYRGGIILGRVGLLGWFSRFFKKFASGDYSGWPYGLLRRRGFKKISRNFLKKKTFFRFPKCSKIWWLVLESLLGWPDLISINKDVLGNVRFHDFSRKIQEIQEIS